MHTHTTYTCCFQSQIHFNFLNQSKEFGGERQRGREFLASGEVFEH